LSEYKYKSSRLNQKKNNIKTQNFIEIIITQFIICGLIFICFVLINFMPAKKNIYSKINREISISYSREQIKNYGKYLFSYLNKNFIANKNLETQQENNLLENYDYEIDPEVLEKINQELERENNLKKN